MKKTIKEIVDLFVQENILSRQVADIMLEENIVSDVFQYEGLELSGLTRKLLSLIGYSGMMIDEDTDETFYEITEKS